MIDGRVVDQEARLEIVGAVEDQIDILEQVFPHWPAVRSATTVWSVTSEFTRARRANCRHGFGESFGRVRFLEQELALQVGPFDEIAVNDAQAAHSGACHGFGLHRTERSAADERHACGADLGLACFAQGVRSGFGGSNGIRRGASNSRKAPWASYGMQRRSQRLKELFVDLEQLWAFAEDKKPSLKDKVPRCSAPEVVCRVKKNLHQILEGAHHPADSISILLLSRSPGRTGPSAAAARGQPAAPD